MILRLEVIASHLAGLEETLIYKLLDRAQFAGNPGAYKPGQSLFRPNEAASLFELRLHHQEKLDTLFGRIVFIAPKFHDRMDRLAALGVIPGSELRLHQRSPSYVIEIGETTIALDPEIAGEIYVKPVDRR